MPNNRGGDAFMAQVRCNGKKDKEKQKHYFNKDLYKVCPICGSDIETENDNNNKEEKTEQFSPKREWLKALSIVLVFIAIGSFFYVQSLESKLLSTKSDLDKITIEYDTKTKELNTKGSVLNISKNAHALFKSLFGSDGQDLYVDTPILVLESGGSSKILQLHRKSDKADKTWLNLLHNYTKNDFTSECCNDIEADLENGNIKVTSGSTKGFNILHVFDSNGKSFDVLIIVK